MLVFQLLMAFLLLMLAIILFTRVVLEVDTRTGLLRASWGRVLHCHFAWHNERGPLIVLRTFFWQWQWYLLELKPSKEKKEPVKKEQRRKSPKEDGSFFFKRRRWFLRSIHRSVRYTQVKYFHWRLDTGDMLLNAQLFPLFHMWHQQGRDVAIDLTGHNALAFQIAHSPARLLWAFRPF